MVMTAPLCHCGSMTRLTNGREVYPHRPDLYAKYFYVCDGCGGRVGCHPSTTAPLGTPANAELRKERSATHAVIDPLWIREKRKRRTARTHIYKYLAQHMDIALDKTHVGMFNVEQCRLARQILNDLTYMQIRKKLQKTGEQIC